MSTIEQRVQAGAAWLDENYEDWVDKINLATLDLATCSHCVLGQLFGHYDKSPLARLEKLTFGFIAMGDENGRFVSPYHTWDVLTTAWRDLISSRRAEAVK